MNFMKEMRARGFCGVFFAASVLCTCFPSLGEECPFAMRWEGRTVELCAARVSAVPFNRVWPGKQRSKEQTRIAWFANFDVASPGILEVEIADVDFRIRPLSRRGPAIREGNVLKIAVSKPEQFVVETGGTEIQVFANPVFRRKAGEGDIHFGAGVHDAGVIEPKSGQSVVIDEGAVVYGSIFIHHAENVTVTGRGILDSSRIARADHKSEQYRRAVAAGLSPDQYGAEMAVNCLTCHASTNVVIEGVTFRDSPRWTLIVRNASRNVAIDNVKMVGMWRYNSDGVDFCASENCSIRNSYIRTFDDCIVTRAPYLDGETTPCRNIVAENCVLWCDWGKNLEVWCGHVPCIVENVTYRNCRLVNISWMACDITTRYGSPSTNVKNVTVENLEIDIPVKPMRECIQRSDGETYPGGLQSRPKLLTVECGQLGKNTGNQGIEAGVGAEAVNVTYENLVFRNFRVHGDACREFLCDMQTEAGTHYALRGLVVENVPGANVKP